MAFYGSEHPGGAERGCVPPLVTLVTTVVPPPTPAHGLAPAQRGVPARGCCRGWGVPGVPHCAQPCVGGCLPLTPRCSGAWG